MSNHNSGTTVPSLQDVAQDSPYGYVPSRTIAIIFLVLFALTTLTHATQAVKYRMWWLLPTAVFCGILEILGWSGRLWSSFSPLASTPFQIQITATIIAPTPLLAANFIIFGRIIRRLGPGYSRLRPKLYTIIFTTCDFVSLVVQGLGGGIAATAATLDGANKGASIMLGGIAFQIVVIVAYASCAIEFFVRYQKRAPFAASKVVQDSKDNRDDASVESSDHVRGEFTQRLRTMTYVLIFTTTCLFIRAIYRAIELSNGWEGRVIHTQVYFNVLDGAMVILSIYATNFFHPGIFLTQTADRTGEVVRLESC